MSQYPTKTEYDLIAKCGAINIRFHAPASFPCRQFADWRVTFGWSRLDHRLDYSEVIRVYEAAKWETFDSANEAGDWLISAIAEARKMPRGIVDLTTWPLLVAEWKRRGIA